MSLSVFICVAIATISGLFFGYNIGKNKEFNKLAKERKDFDNHRIKANAEVEYKLNRAIKFYGKYAVKPEGFFQISDNAAITALIVLKNELGLPLTVEEYQILNHDFVSINNNNIDY